MIRHGWTEKDAETTKVAVNSNVFILERLFMGAQELIGSRIERNRRNVVFVISLGSK
jgi:hypothetical protein